MQLINTLISIPALCARLFQPRLPSRDLLKIFSVGAGICPGEQAVCPRSAPTDRYLVAQGNFAWSALPQRPRLGQNNYRG